MAKKVVLTGFIASLLFVSLMVFSLPALAQNENAKTPDLPEDARFTTVPSKAIIGERNGEIAVAKPLITTANDPDLRLTGSAEFTGVGILILPRTDIPEGFVGICTGTLLDTRMHILTAAHCVTDDSGAFTLESGAEIRFGTDINAPTHNYSIDVPNVKVHPNHLGDGNVLNGYDLAILPLTETVASEIDHYVLYSGDQTALVDNHIIIHKVGFGNTGLLINGATAGTLGDKRDGQNRLDDTGKQLVSEFWNIDSGERIIMYDADHPDGLSKNDAFGRFDSNLADVGLGDLEMNVAGGDSGGPGFYDNNGTYEIISVTSFGVATTGPADCHKDMFFGINFADSSCGEFAGDMSTIQCENRTFIEESIGNGPVTCVVAPAAPELVSPADNTEIDDLTPTFDWNDVSGESDVTYTLEVYYDSNLESLVFSQTALLGSTFTPVSDLTDNTTFYWRVMANDGGANPGPWSSVWSFTTNTSGGSVGGDVMVTGISPFEIIKSENLTLQGVTVSGSGFDGEASVTFENGCGPSPSASIVSVSGDHTITVDITVSSGGPPKGCTFDVRVTNGDTSTGIGSDLFTVRP